MPRVAIIIIGDEILTGKFQDENTSWLIKRCNELYLQVEGVQIIRDDVETIAHAVLRESHKVDYVFTTGGVGPTHDDLTMQSIAKAFDVPLERNPTLEKIIVEKFKSNESALRMADVPQGAVLWEESDLFFPQVVMKNVIILPGIPKLMRLKFNAISHRFSGIKTYVKKLYLQSRESTIAVALGNIQAQHPEVSIGSYPRLDEWPVTLILTIEGTDSEAVQAVQHKLAEEFADYLVSAANSES